MLAENRLRKGQTDKKKIWQAALYVRLSREDGDKEESDSIVNQKELLQQFVAFEADIAVHDVYVDDGWSGTNFERPEFIRMMGDIKAGAVSCVIVKDLSRFGRNYIDVGQYIEKIFPLMDIRFISVTDNLDSVKNPQTMNNIIVPFKNLINDEYCRDISNKVRSSLDLKRKQGKHIGSFACYGYKKDPEDHNHLVIDSEAAEVVRDIFKWYKSGMSILGIAKKLNQLGIPNPSNYKKEQGLHYKNRHEKITDKRWPESSVRRILSNRMYTGDLVQGTIRIKSYKVQVAQRQPEDDWIIVPGTHEAVVSKEDFEIVQELLHRNTRVAPAKADAKVYLFSGFIRCGDCRRSMYRKHYSYAYGEYNYFGCTTYAKRDKNACTKHSIREDTVEKIVLQSIQMQIALAVDMKEAIEAINSHKVINKEAATLRKTIDRTKEELAQIDQLALDLYPDWKTGVITQTEYMQLKDRFAEQKLELSKKIEDLMNKVSANEKGQDKSNQFLENFIRYKNIDHLTREVVVALIDMIYVYEENRLKIVFKYQDPYEAAREYIKNNQELLDGGQAEKLFSGSF